MIVLDLFGIWSNVSADEDNRRQEMAIECTRCGGPTMSETVIKLRRSVLGFLETRSQGAYCATCKLSAPVETPSAPRPPTRINARPRRSVGGFLPVWLRGAPVRSGFGRTLLRVGPFVIARRYTYQ
jgi:hypothetical protein